jgi:hypothetical protein
MTGQSYRQGESRFPQGVDKRVGNHTRVTLLPPAPHGVADVLAIFGGCVQATQKR